MTEAPVSYHATVALSRPEREQRNRQARTQDDQVLDWFRMHPSAELSAEDVHAELAPTWPLGSTRRALSNLKNRGVMERTDHLVEGSQGHSVHCYRLARPCPQHQERLF
jgi:hypothetical protein